MDDAVSAADVAYLGLGIGAVARSYYQIASMPLFDEVARSLKLDGSILDSDPSTATDHLKLAAQLSITHDQYNRIVSDPQWIVSTLRLYAEDDAKRKKVYENLPYPSAVRHCDDILHMVRNGSFDAITEEVVLFVEQVDEALKGVDAAPTDAMYCAAAFARSLLKERSSLDLQGELTKLCQALNFRDLRFKATAGGKIGRDYDNRRVLTEDSKNVIRKTYMFVDHTAGGASQ